MAGVFLYKQKVKIIKKSLAINLEKVYNISVVYFTNFTIRRRIL